MKKINYFFISVGLIFLGALILRFFRLAEFVTFLGDQGRDAIIIKRIVTLEDFPAIGAPSSIGSVFLGPFYYYLVSPFLGLFRFDPTGLAYGVAFLSLVGIIASFIVAKKYTGSLAAVLFLFFISFCSVLVELSRFSWNPNLLPVFSFITLYFFYRSFIENKTKEAFIFGSFLALALQLHHLAGLILLACAVTLLIYKKFLPFKELLIKIGFALAGFIVFNAPLILFDLRHDFLNSRNLLLLFTQKNIVSNTSFFERFTETMTAFFTHIFLLSVSPWMAFTIFIILVGAAYFLRKEKFIMLHLLNVVLFLISFSLLSSSRHPHYFGSVYYSFFLITAYGIAVLSIKNIYKAVLIFSILTLFLFVNTQKYTFLYSRGSNQVQRAQSIAQSILDHSPVLPYQVASIPSTETDGHIRYFLELGNKTPLPDTSADQPAELYVLCYEPSCNVIAHPQWQIAAFKRAKVDTIWTTNGITIYKLIHEK